ncbi:MAG: Smr/MutS family protein [Bacteroidetes bacterium]|nr:Smr/MutS family protein [Bacteroidota bacterium]
MSENFSINVYLCAMIYPQNIEQKIGFDLIRNHILELCKSDLGKNHIEELHFSQSQEFIEQSLNCCAEMKNICEYDSDFPTPSFSHVWQAVQSIKPDETFFQPADLFILRKSLLEIHNVLQYFKKREDSYPALFSLTESVAIPREVCTAIDKIIDSTAQLKDNASKQLVEIRSAIQQKKHAVAKIMAQKINIARKEGWCESDTELSMRNDRLVIPFHTAFKRKIQGFVHDESISGKTSFVEPVEAFEINNQIQSLHYEEQKEIVRILKEITAFIRPFVGEIEVAYSLLGVFDSLQAKAKFALRIDANKPHIVPQSEISLYGARHPLLVISFEKSGFVERGFGSAQPPGTPEYRSLSGVETTLLQKSGFENLSHQKDRNSRSYPVVEALETTFPEKVKIKKQVIPLHVELNAEQRLLLISGPNAGGKSVCLKTIALLQYMLQCGLLIPADAHSKVGIFRNLFIDIGDEQSLENDLSTYSSHLQNMKYFITHADAKTLVCIDEFGTGTEPMLGGAIAESVLETLHNNGAFGVITTHYTNLKHAASALKFAINGAMLFDLQELKPLYKLRMGSAGSSFAFEIAASIGLPPQVIERAKHKIGKEHVDFDKNLKKLEEEKQYIFKKKESLKRQQEEIQGLKKSYSHKLEELTHKRNELLAQTQKEVKEIIEGANKSIESAIRSIKEAQADKEKTKLARQKLQEEAQHIERAISKKLQKQSNSIISSSTPLEGGRGASLTIGDYVRIKGQSAIGQIVELNKKQAQVQYSHSSLSIALQNLERTQKPKNEHKTQLVQSTTETISRKRNEFSPKLDLRGKRGDEALYEVKDFIETAYMLQVRRVEILHGKGYGILRKLVRDYLLSTDIVASCTDAPLDLGGDGITVVELTS